jgi:hypothetical protein
VKLVGRRAGRVYRLRGTFGGWFMRVRVGVVIEMQPEPLRLAAQYLQRGMKRLTAVMPARNAAV